MTFLFTFKLNVPGLSNPFSTATPSTSIPPTLPDKPSRNRVRSAETIPLQRASPVPSLSPAAPSSRKRGWEPSFAEPSRSTTTIASTSGYLDTPAKYREMAAASNDEFHEVDEVAAFAAELPPPAKRRRGLGGSIVSTALSAALIGTAVGLTVYRLWRDRGKEPEQLPPPPYQQGEWTPVSAPQTIHVSPPTPRGRKSRHPVSSTGKRPIANLRRPRVRHHGHTPGPSPSLFPPTQPEFDFSHVDNEGGVVEDQMDWIGDKLSMLIEQGKKALGREVVVMSDAREDEVDDGTDAWEEEDQHHTAGGPSSIPRSSSVRRTKKPRNLAVSPPSYASHRSPSASPKTSRFDLPGAGSSPVTISPRRGHSRGMSVESESSVNASSSFREDERTWESPELRESMEKARARLLRNRVA